MLKCETCLIYDSSPPHGPVSENDDDSSPSHGPACENDDDSSPPHGPASKNNDDSSSSHGPASENDKLLKWISCLYIHTLIPY